MIYREITDIDPQDMSVDTSGTKNYSLFLTELSQLVAKDMIMCVEPLTIHLGGEVRRIEEEEEEREKLFGRGQNYNNIFIL